MFARNTQEFKVKAVSCATYSQIIYIKYTYTFTKIKNRERDGEKVNVVKWEIWVKGIQKLFFYS